MRFWLPACNEQLETEEKGQLEAKVCPQPRVGHTSATESHLLCRLLGGRSWLEACETFKHSVPPVAVSSIPQFCLERHRESLRETWKERERRERKDDGWTGETDVSLGEVGLAQRRPLCPRTTRG